MRTRSSEKTFLPAKARGILYLPVACLMLYAVHAYGETKSVTVTFGSHAYQTFKTTQPGENHTLNINKATPAPNIARSLITAQDEQDQVIWKPAQITATASTHTYTMSGSALDEPLWVEIEGAFVKAAGGAGAPRMDFQVTVLKVEITFADPDDSIWGDLEEKKVILSDKDTRIKLKVTPQLADIQTIFDVLGTTLKIKTSGTAPSGQNCTLTTENTTLIQSNGYSEMRVALTRDNLKSLGVLPSQEDDGITEKAWYDTGDANSNATSNLRDGEAFESSMSATSRGRCTQVGDLNSTPPNSPLDGSFFKAAGVEIVTAEYGGAVSIKRQVMNQADFFYYSGHGWHISGTTAAGGPSDVSGYWNKDMNVVIIAGCSVLDINDYENNFTNPVEHAKSPGKDWEPLGPAYLLGYNYEAPNDLQNSDTIISSWCANYGSSGVVEAWRDANDNSNGRNACAITAGTSYFYFHKLFPLIYVWTEVSKSEW